MTRTTAELRQYLAGEWLFDNDFKDTSGNGNHGIPTGIEWKPTLRGMKPKFNGSSSRLEVAIDASLDISNNISTCGWIKLSATGINQRIVEHKTTALRTDGYGIRVGTDDKINFITTNSAKDAKSTTVALAGIWYHFAVIQSGTTKYVYVNGALETTVTDCDVLVSANSILRIGTSSYSLQEFLNDYLSEIEIYNVDLTETEVLNLYNETKGEYGVIPAEHSFTHNPDDVIDASGAVGAWGTTKESTTKLVDISGNNNIADIHGAMPTEGFIQGRRFTAANSNYLDCGNDSSLNPASFTIHSVFKTGTDVSSPGRPFNSFKDTSDGFGLYINNNKIYIHDDMDIHDVLIYENDILPNTFYISTVLLDASDSNRCDLSINGSLIGNDEFASNDFSSFIGKLVIGQRGNASNFFDGNVFFNIMIPSATSLSHTLFFNTLAHLPFWSITYIDYPDNTTEYTDNLPYSSSIISSGTFKVDDDKLQCVSAGTMTYSASYNFDGSEYITATIGGVEYAGTGTITQGNTTVSVAQDSNKVTIEASTGDTIDSIDIQFRDEV